MPIFLSKISEIELYLLLAPTNRVKLLPSILWSISYVVTVATTFPEVEDQVKDCQTIYNSDVGPTLKGTGDSIACPRVRHIKICAILFNTKRQRYFLLAPIALSTYIYNKFPFSYVRLTLMGISQIMSEIFKNWQFFIF